MSALARLKKEEEEGGPPTPQQRKLHIKRKPTRKESAKLSPIYMGLAINVKDNKLEYAVVVHDGMGVVGSEHDSREGNNVDITDGILDRAKEYAAARGHKIAMFAVAGPLVGVSGFAAPTQVVDRNARPSFLSRVWLELDAIPFMVPCKGSQFSLEGEAVAAIEKALSHLHPTSTAIIEPCTSSLRREVEVDARGMAHLFDLNQQAAITSPTLWDTFIALGAPLKKNNIRVSFFSATPQGGGVALMRHALIRLWNLVGVDCKWYVPQGDSAVFDVTKRKFHNILQGVNPAGAELTTENKDLFERWTKWNYERFWKDDEVPGKNDAPTKAEIVVIDDPQLTALIPMIRRDSPNTKIIYRSHIQIRSDLIDSNTSPQVDVFKYLFNYIKDTDLFVSHPVKDFVPKMVSEHMPVVYMPPSTDPLDGLNKPIPEEYLATYRGWFDDIMQHSTGQKLDWKRGYILQVARFDPSKGIPYLVEGYRLFRERIKKEGSDPKKAPQLVLTGHGSVDDPDGTYILHMLQETFAKNEFADIREDIFSVRAPPDDRLLDAMMRGCDVACQVSTREGYEIKVTEAIHKTRWIIATQAGGIPLQVRDGIDGKLVPPSDGAAIGEALYEFYADGRDGKTGESLGNDVTKPLGGRWDDKGKGPREELFTVGNCTMWEFLFCTVLGLDKDRVAGLPEEQLKCLSDLGVDTPKDFWQHNEKRVWEDLIASTRAK